MRALLFIACLFYLCHAATASAALEKQTIKQGVLTREYWLHDPRKDDGGKNKTLRPLVIVLHGGGGKAEKFDGMTGKNASFDALADREDLLVAYPQGFKKQWNDGREVSHIEAQALDLDDVGFISSLIDRLVETHAVDPRRVYATGPSNGGHMSNRLACDLADKIAAVGIVIANMPVKVVNKCKPAQPVSVLIMNGTDDPLVPVNGGEVRLTKRSAPRGEDISTAETFSFWLGQAGADKKQDFEKELLPDADPDDKTRVTKQGYKGRDAEVVLYTVEGGGHTWPGGRQYLFEFMVGRTSRDINATEVIWDFFKRNPKP
jgi:polyhydroxybutyrate depolymerase